MRVAHRERQAGGEQRASHGEVLHAHRLAVDPPGAIDREAHRRAALGGEAQ